MKKYSLLLAILLSAGVFAIERKIVVLTSIKTPKRQPFWRSKEYSVEKDIERRFRRYFKDSGYQVEYIHRAGALDLNQALTSDSTLALFWVSHASGGALGLFGSSIQDYHGNDVKDVFQKVNPNLRFLAVAGCKGAVSIEKFKARGFYKNNPDLKISAFKENVLLGTGLARAIKDAAPILDANPRTYYRHPRTRMSPGFPRYEIQGRKELNDLDAPVKAKPSGIKTTIANTNSEARAILTVNGEFVGVLKASHRPQTFYLPEEISNGERAKLIVDYDSYISESPNELIIDIEGMESPELLTMPDGSAYGRYKNFYYINDN